MLGLMMDWPLTLQTILERARRLHGRREIVSRTPAGMHRYTYADYVALRALPGHSNDSHPSSLSPRRPSTAESSSSVTRTGSSWLIQSHGSFA